MGELRKDYILDRWVVISPARAKRPHEVATHHDQAPQICSFCPGNEATTPPEIGRLEQDNAWSLRWFSNKYPAFAPQGDPLIQTDNTFYTFSSSYGYHELITETPNHDLQLWDFSTKELATLLEVYNKRIEELMLAQYIKYVDIIKNHGSDAGTSIIHSHSQVFALNHIPALIREEIEAYRRYQVCPYCSIIAKEKDSHRRCYENSDFVAFTPYASRYNYEIWIFPKHHVKNLSSIGNMDGLAEILGCILRKLRELNVSYNYTFHYSPVDDFHFHIEITPRISIPGGFEIGSDEFINIISPEDAAAFYRGEHGSY
ncbi:MAG: DUF4921 family protein [Nanoarchaeota archaeon]